MRTHTDTIKEIEALLNSGQFELVSYGLAPNPFGFCFESMENANINDKKRLSKLLDSLDENEEEYLRMNYL